MAFEGNVVLLLVVVASICMALLKTDVRPIVQTLPDLVKLEGNSRLGGNLVQHIGEGELLGPESLAESAGYLFASLADGTIARLEEGDGSLKWETLIRTGHQHDACGQGGPGDRTDTEKVCGRPLGLRAARRKLVTGAGDDEVLLVADATMGLLMISGLRKGETPEKQQLLKHCSALGRDLRLANDLVQAPDGTIYVTETSDRFDRRRIFHAAVDGHADGRVLSLSPVKDSKGNVTFTCEVLAEGIFMANGISLSHDGRSVLVISGVELLEIGINGKRRGVQRKLFPTDSGALPGTGDNIRTHVTTPTGERRKCYWVGLGSKYAEPFNLLHFIRGLPSVRWLIAAALPYEWLVELIPKYGMFAVLDEEGKLIETFQDPSGRTPWISEVHAYRDFLVLGSWYNNFLSVVRKDALP